MRRRYMVNIEKMEENTAMDTRLGHASLESLSKMHTFPKYMTVPAIMAMMRNNVVCKHISAFRGKLD